MYRCQWMIVGITLKAHTKIIEQGVKYSYSKKQIGEGKLYPSIAEFINSTEKETHMHRRKVYMRRKGID